MFVVCPEHHGNITSDTDNVNIELSEEARVLITGIKLYEKEKCKEDINKSITSSLTKDTLLLDNTVIEDDLALLRVENELLKQLNQEIQDKNALLQELLACKNNNIMHQDVTSYADKVKTDKSSTREVIPDIIVKAKNNNNTKTMEHVRNKILVDIAVPIKKIFANKNGEVTIKCQNKIDVTRTTTLLSEKMDKDYNINAKTVNLPRVKIHDVQNDMSIQEIEVDIKNRNSFMLSDSFSLISDYRNARKQRNIIMEVSPGIYENIVKNNYKLFVGFQCCKVYDIVNISLCFKCGQINHNSKKCKNEPKCLKCAGDHLTSACNSNTLKCLNCDFYNKKYKQNKCTNHHPNDTSGCEYIKHKIQKLMKETDYPTLPKIPKYLGKIPGQVLILSSSAIRK